jgi:hypothetical protein
LWFESDHCLAQFRAANRRKRDEKILEFVGDQPFTVEQVLDFLHGQYQDYRKTRRLNEQLSGGQQAPKSPPQEGESD